MKQVGSLLIRVRTGDILLVGDVEIVVTSKQNGSVSLLVKADKNVNIKRLKREDLQIEDLGSIRGK